MELIRKTNEEMVFISDMNVSLANAIRRSVGDIPILAIVEADIYKNDSVLYDEIITHRLGLLSLKNQKLKGDDSVEMKLKAKGKGDSIMVMAGALGDNVVYPETPLVLLSDRQEIELVARAKQGTGNAHAKFSPGVIFYKHLAKIKILGEGEKQIGLAELYPEVFEVLDEKLKVKNEWACNLDEEDVEDYPGISIEIGGDLIFSVESWGQIKAEEIFIGACKYLKENLLEVLKIVK